jgi:hypothetical protein
LLAGGNELGLASVEEEALLAGWAGALEIHFDDVKNEYNKQSVEEWFEEMKYIKISIEVQVLS